MGTFKVRQYRRQSTRLIIWFYHHKLEKIQRNVSNVILHLLMQAVWGNIWKHTVEKSQTNAISVIVHRLGHTIWQHRWKSIRIAVLALWPAAAEELLGRIPSLVGEHFKTHSGEKSNSCSLAWTVGHTAWQHTWKSIRIMQKKMESCLVGFLPREEQIWEHTVEKSKPVWLFIGLSTLYGNTRGKASESCRWWLLGWIPS